MSVAKLTRVIIFGGFKSSAELVFFVKGGLVVWVVYIYIYIYIKAYFNDMSCKMKSGM
jgi:hypothetical protein